MSHLTTHVLDAATGAPAVGVGVALARLKSGGVLVPVDEGRTDEDGRLALGPELLHRGIHSLTFNTGAYFAGLDTPTFYPFVTVTFTVEVAPDGTSRHYHVPLLLSPFAYSTYRGS